jgi:hypothetical protein
MMHASTPPHRYKISADHLLRISVILVLAAISSAGVFFYLFEIDLINHLPTKSLCPFQAITGLACPGCGMTRAMISLGQLKPGAAIGYNLFSIPLLSLMILYVWPGKFHSFLQHQIFSIFIFILVIIVWLIRLSGMKIL